MSHITTFFSLSLSQHHQQHKHFSIYSQEFNVKYLQHKYFTTYCFKVENDRFLNYACSRTCKEPDIVLKDNSKLCLWPKELKDAKCLTFFNYLQTFFHHFFLCVEVESANKSGVESHKEVTMMTHTRTHHRAEENCIVG